ncbi:MAG: PilN domain-containing protein [Rhodocyclaceae bacterium]|nr:PilN domain-containing protein [Rhodocyclaceae bacterium]
MIVRINLLPHREAKRKAIREQFYALMGLVTVLAGVVWLAGFTFINNLIDRQQMKNDFLKKEIATLDKEIAEIKKLREQTEALLARKRVIESLQVNRAETVHVFNELAKNMPPGVYLRSIKQEGEKITLTGHAQSNARVSALMQNLDASAVFERPALIEIKAVQSGKMRVNEFALIVHLTRQAEGSEAKRPLARAEGARS